MRNRTKVICFVVFAAFLAVWLFIRQRSQLQDSVVTPTTPTNLPQTANPAMPANLTAKQQFNGLPSSPPIPYDSQRTVAASNAVSAQILSLWQNPIEFYGKVVDENTNAVVGAKVKFQWAEMPTEDGNRTSATESDSEGLFSLHGQHGPDLMVAVSKEGYYASHRGEQGFKYGPFGDPGFSPDPQNPVIFYLRKKGTPESLVHVAGTGLHAMRDFLLAADGKPTEVSLRDGRLAAAGQGDLKVEFQAGQALDNSPSKISWKCRVTVPGGGLIETTEEFPFLAPENNYTGSDEWSVGTTNWTEQVNKKYYVKLPDGNFGRIQLRVIGTTRAFFRLESFLNPTGSRNLEPAN